MLLVCHYFKDTAYVLYNEGVLVHYDDSRVSCVDISELDSLYNQVSKIDFIGIYTFKGKNNILIMQRNVTMILYSSSQLPVITFNKLINMCSHKNT